jgi:hypothetical protein
MHFTNTRAAARSIAIVCQELKLFENLNVAENIFPGCGRQKGVAVMEGK